MRKWLALLSLMIAGCHGNVADYMGPRSTIISPQLIRYGIGLNESRCVASHLATSLTPLQLRRFQRLAASVRQGYFEPDHLSARDLAHIAASMRDPAVSRELIRANETCGVATETAAAPPPAPSATPATPRAAVWLNLGAAPTGQTIAIDASTLEQDASSRKAWFRLTNPGENRPLTNAYLLRIDCAHRTIQSLAHRRDDPAGGAAASEVVAETEGPLPVEGGTVMEIAFLAMCT